MTKILAVDDTKLMRDMLAKCLRDGGHDVVSASDGKEALDKLREFRPAFVVTDLNMPVMDGLEFIEQARQEDCGRHLPMLLLTTETAQRLKQRAREVGATGWLNKPFDPDQLLRLVDQLT
jgi:two-component system chemotaxis response regulator CheY